MLGGGATRGSLEMFERREELRSRIIVGRVDTHEFYTKVELKADTCEPITGFSICIRPHNLSNSEDAPPWSSS